MRIKNKMMIWLLMLVMVSSAVLTGCTDEQVNSAMDTAGKILDEVDTSETPPETAQQGEATVEESGTYISKDEVALYIHLYDKLPANFITKKQAEKLGWDSSKGNLQDIAPGKSIGGSRFGNYENQLPDGKYKECDINYTGGYRGAERIIYSDEGKIYYTGDHYATFEELY
ncbi:MAG: ribonuclease domain-containing protein [Lachnospiraceae bacterium]|nr:ribonuclease domain-containing protein [Lachnospiraceae bacterium]